MRVAGRSHPASDLEHVLKGSGFIRATLVGVAAGISAAFIMEQFQTIVGSLSKNEDAGSDEGEESKPTTVKTADMVSEAMSGKPIPDEMQSVAGAAVHYGFGAFLGGLYGAIGAVKPGVTGGFGTAYGAAAALLADEAMVPALGLSPPPQETPASVHAYGMISHFVFGAALEGSRRIIETLVSPRENGHAEEADEKARRWSARGGASA